MNPQTDYHPEVLSSRKVGAITKTDLPHQERANRITACAEIRLTAVSVKKPSEIGSKQTDKLNNKLSNMRIDACTDNPLDGNAASGSRNAIEGTITHIA
ncbi:hypothetical protein HNR39_000652 [Glaciimonas immobilis]|uniref:Uncharacterized protein n=1 Tax=Glaciimonas immobilis TaxID=728004 RepID=A0A840RNZ9_9BURK|nr:hypothetical protein [Glaciimonas immobilis]